MVPEWFGLLASVLFGLVFGSFANVVIYRFPRAESLSHPGSHCPQCGRPVRWYDNVPVVSWVLLRAKCRSCGRPISVRYPIIEALSGVLWGMAWVRFGFTWKTPFAIGLFYLLMILAAIDLDTYRLPNKLVGLLAAIGGVGVIGSAVSGRSAVPLLGDGDPVVGALVGVVASAGLALMIAGIYAVVRKREGFGMGDVKLLAALGLFLGTYGVLVLFVASVIGAGVGIWAATRSDQGLAAKIPFGPYLAAGAVLVVMWGPQAWSWYVGLIA